VIYLYKTETARPPCCRRGTTWRERKDRRGGYPQWLVFRSSFHDMSLHQYSYSTLTRPTFDAWFRLLLLAIKSESRSVDYCSVFMLGLTGYFQSDRHFIQAYTYIIIVIVIIMMDLYIKIVINVSTEFTTIFSYLLGYRSTRQQVNSSHYATSWLFSTRTKVRFRFTLGLMSSSVFDGYDSACTTSVVIAIFPKFAGTSCPCVWNHVRNVINIINIR